MRRDGKNDMLCRASAGPVAPELAAKEYGAEVLVAGIEDHAQNYTRFHLLRRELDARAAGFGVANKLTVAFAVEHRPGTLVRALELLAEAGVNLTKIESRPVPANFAATESRSVFRIFHFVRSLCCSADPAKSSLARSSVKPSGQPTSS